MKEFARNEVAGFQASVLLKVNFCTFIFQNFINCLKTPISRNAFLWLLQSVHAIHLLMLQSISSVYFFCLVIE